MLDTTIHKETQFKRYMLDTTIHKETQFKRYMLKVYIKYFDTAVFTLNFHFINFCLEKLARCR